MNIVKNLFIDVWKRSAHPAAGISSDGNAALKYDSIRVEPNGKVTFSYEGRDLLWKDVYGYDPRFDTLRLTGLKGVMEVDLG